VGGDPLATAGVIVQSGSTATVWCNAFQANRLSTNGSGPEGDGYEAYQNLVTGTGTGTGSAVFMNKVATGVGGKYVNIHDNWFNFNPTPFYTSIRVSGVPTDGTATITGNYFTQGQVDGSSTAAVQSPGVPAGATLRADNTFNATINVTDDGQPNCTLTVQSATVGHVNCDVL
jgi:hypothetical protein